MKHLTLFVVALFFFCSTLFAELQQKPDRKLLEIEWPLETVQTALIPRDEWRPFPTVSEPAGLESVPHVVRDAHIAQGEALLEAEWPSLPASVFLDYVRNGNRSRFESLSFGRRNQLGKLVVAELFERKGRFLDQIINGVWLVCEETFWGVPAHLYGHKAKYGLPDVNEPYVDLFAAETASLLAWIHYLLAPQLDEVNKLISDRIELEIDRRILAPYFETEAWGWMGFRYRHRTGYERPVNNWNPWINSNMLACALLIEKDDQRRAQLVHKIMKSIDNFVEPYPADGGCDEGPSYWGRAGASLFDCLYLLDLASNGEIDVFDQPLIQEMGRYISRVYISDPWFINFADASAKMRVIVDIVHRYGEAIEDESMKGLAAFTAQKTNYGQGALGGSYGGLNRLLPALMNLNDVLASKPVEPAVRDVWMSDLNVMIARSENSAKGFYIAAKGGHNDESHNHNDVGNFIVYYDGKPVLIDAGAQTYTRKTFSNQRYELWNNQSAFHNLPTINGVMQHVGAKYAAKDVSYKANDRRVLFSLDISDTYPVQAGVKTWKRSLVLNRGKNIELSENYKLTRIEEPIQLNFLTTIKSDVSQPGIVSMPVEGKIVKLKYDKRAFTADIERIEINDSRLGNSWGDALFRIVLTSTKRKLNGTYRIKIEQ
jgi:hypothetical protein